MALTGAAVLSGDAFAQGASKFPAGLIYTKDAPGRWAGREGSHAPKVTMDGTVLKINQRPHDVREALHRQTHAPYAGRQVFGRKDFRPDGQRPDQSYTLPDGFKGTVWAASFCNIHDLWVTEFKI